MSMIKIFADFLDQVVARLTKYGVILCITALFILLMARIISRALEVPVMAYDEFVELATVWMIILGTIALWRDGTLYRVSLVADVAPGFGHWCEVFIQAVMLAFALLLVWIGGEFTAMSHEVTPFMQIDKTYYYGSIPVGAAVMSVYSVGGLVRAVRVLWSGNSFGVTEPSDPQANALADHL